jgi:hypothetical protein
MDVRLACLAASLVTVAATAAGCGAPNEAALDQEAIQDAAALALGQIPYDTVCEPRGCGIVVVDPRVRTSTGVRPEEPERLPVLTELQDVDVAQVRADGRSFVLSERNSNLLAQSSDSLIVFIQVRVSEEPSRDNRTVSVVLLMRSVAWWGGMSVVSLETRGEEWVVVSVSYSEL